MLHFTLIDYLSFAWFSTVWFGYAWLNDYSRFRKRGLNWAMDRHREHWMHEAGRREMRILDTSIMATLQSGTAFFASTSMIALGAAFSMLSQADHIVKMFMDLSVPTTGAIVETEIRILGLCAIYGFAFFQFGWAYRLFNYAAILLGSVQEITDRSREEDVMVAHETIKGSTAMQIVAGRHFNWGLRALFFSIGYLGIFVNAYVFMASTTFILFVLLKRQYFSAAARAAAIGL